jgi:hypothetical protein
VYRLNIDIKVAVRKAIYDAWGAGARGEVGMADSHRYWQETTDLSEYTETISDFLEEEGGTWGLWQAAWREDIAQRDDGFEDDDYEDDD